MTGADTDGSPPWIILGLGNPDDEYGNSRHNAGAMVVGLLADRAGATLKRSSRTRARRPSSPASGAGEAPAAA